MSRAVGRQAKASGLLAGACLLAAASAFGKLEGTPLPRSTLISRPDLQFSLVQRQREGQAVTLLVHAPVQGDPVPVAALRATGDGLSIERLPASKDIEVDTLERLYVLALRQEPLATYELDGKRHSHAELLRTLAEARQAALPQRDGKPWKVISMSPAVTDGQGNDLVAVRVTLDRRPMAGASIYFNRAPHSSCVAKSGVDGIAACQLVDQHGDEGDADEDKAAVTATFGGDVGKDRVLVPITGVVREAK